MYIRLKTDHSLLESTLDVQSAIELTRNAGSSFFAVCENGHFGSIAQAYKQAKRANLQFVAAIELKVLIDFESTPLIAICKNESGYRRLLAYHEMLNKPLELDFLQAIDAADLMWIPVLGLSEFPKMSLLKQHLHVEYVGLRFSERLQPFEVDLIRQFEQNERVLCCMMNAIVMKDEKEQHAHAVMQAIKTNSRDIAIHTTVVNTFLEKSRLEHFIGLYPELLVRLEDIVAKTRFELAFVQKMPKYPFTENDSSEVFLQKLVLKGASRRYRTLTEEVRERVKKELDVIVELGFADYFLILWDAKRYAFTNDILFGPGRGSSVGSIVAYCLGITEVDPLRYGLVFERFLNKGRKSYPDIDIDVADDKREKLIEYIKARYGASHVAHILTYGTFGAKSAFREVARIHGVSSSQMSDVTKLIARFETLSYSYANNERLRHLLSRDRKLMRCYQIALQIEGLKRNTSTHAAGIIITENKLSTMLPVFAESGYTTAWEMKELEESGFLKIDFLGLKNLSILDELEQGVQVVEPQFQMHAIPLDDVQTYQYLAYGLTNGIFQLESNGIKKVLKDLKPTQFEDIVAVLALYRPGPMESIPLFIARKYGHQKVTMPHADLTAILAETYGVIVYQEQIMQIVHTMANFDLTQADDFRRAVSKKDEKLLTASLSTFEKAALIKGYTSDVVTQVSHLMLQFANYGFVKGHAVAYALIAYRLMFFKVHYPISFYTVVLNHHIQDTMKVITYVQEMKRRKLMLLPPDIILSDPFFKIEKKQIRMGLCSIKGIGKQSAVHILNVVAETSEKSANGIIQALLRKRVSKEHIEALILVGAFDRFQFTRQTLVMYVRSQNSEGSDYGHLGDLIDVEQELKHFPEYTKKECEQFERHYLNYPFFQNMFEQFEQEYRARTLLPVQTLLTLTTHTHQTVARVVSIRRHRNGETRFIQIEDNTGELSAVVFDSQIFQNIYIELGEIYHFHVKCSLYKRRSSYQIVKIAPIVS